jgi:Cu+-exporting ATPase
VPIVVLAMVLPMTPTGSDWSNVEIIPGLTYCGVVLLVLTTPVEFFVGYRFHKKALMSLRTRTLGMDFMISTGSLAAYLCSVIGMARGVATGTTSSMDTSYFDTSAVLITAVLLGKYLEIYARGQTASAIHKLTAMKAKTARLVGTLPADKYSKDSNVPLAYLPLLAAAEGSSTVADGSSSQDEQIIDSSLLHKFDVIRLVAGEAIPADGELLAGGHIGVDESMMTVCGLLLLHEYL